ncbi:hypothetical protein BJF79_45735 [Actinomadura sp. CNU-125]|uniref:LCP family protein n=1 Tax=Actinomadura sp. CNU-125 TaxID=1904961 RepID=UPI0009617B2F|nr:LCP family protein [Actinomadura sp. CNU-125]OLT24021.1 hypothetical protein BJF79_45735 [Actinomadura sp. CNU-125]
MQRAVAPPPVYYADEDDDAPRVPEPPGRVWRALGWMSIVLSVALVIGSLSAYGFWRKLDGRIDREDVKGKLGENRPEKLNDATNILLLGSDSREGENSRYGTEIGRRSDTAILLHISPGGKGAIGLSFPRDSMVQIPECKTDTRTVPARFGMINSAFAEGGPACTWQTIEALTKIHIDHYVEVDFAGFTRVVDALGGVEICVPRAVNDPRAELNLKAGRQTVKGEQALGYVRTRHGLGDGSDLERIKRQQAFMASIVKKATDGSMLTDPARVYAFLEAIADSIRTDEDMTLSVMQDLATGLRGISAGNVRFVTVPVQAYPQDRNRVQFDRAKAEPLFAAVREDNTVPEPEPEPAKGAPPVQPAEVKVGVYNGTTSSGLGKRTAEQLAARGFDVVKVGNADKVYEKTAILYGTGAQRQAQRLANALPGHKPKPWKKAKPGYVYLVIGGDGAKLRGVNPVPKVAGEVRADQDICASN